MVVDLSVFFSGMEDWIGGEVLADILSHQSIGVRWREIPRSLKRDGSQIISDIALARLLYSNSVPDRAAVRYFLELQEIRFGPTSIIKPPTDRLSSWQPAQSAFENPCREDMESGRK